MMCFKLTEDNPADAFRIQLDTDNKFYAQPRGRVKPETKTVKMFKKVRKSLEERLRHRERCLL